MPKPSQRPRNAAARPPNAINRSNASEAPELVDPAFLLKALGAVLGVCLILAYITLCIVYLRSSWQLVLTPSRTLAATPASLSLPFTEVHFDNNAKGQAQLDAWWLPADAAPGTQPTRTALILHGQDGSMANALPIARTLHELDLNVLLFDYRGYGRSALAHPTESTMQQDSSAALDYLLNQRHLPAASILVYGHDLGASLALHLCATATTNCPALILDAPDGDTFARVAANPNSSAVPASLLFHDRFPLAEPLATSSTPKLLILHSNNPPPAILSNAHDPKTILAVQPGDETSLHTGIQRFLDETLR